MKAKLYKILDTLCYWILRMLPVKEELAPRDGE